MTEDEAKTKWCPFARVAAVPDDDRGSSAAYNRLLIENPEAPEGADFIESSRACRCIGSACMTWRWGGPDQRGPEPIGHSILPVGQAADLVQRPGHRWFAGEKDATGLVEWALFPMLGHCGLAGKP